ncbi:membrane protein [Microbacterium phage TurboVicky]|nr:membrane protein [Microbacterium phage Typher]UVK60359.1 membrane protein [Microbacterium phage TurboVicky]
MTDGMTNEQFRILREDFAQMRTEFNLRFDNLVTRDTFKDERQRVDSLIQGQGREIGELKRDLASEAQARVTERQDALKAQLAEKAEREKLRRQTLWQWFALAASLVGAPIIGGLIGAAMATAGITP